METAEPYRDERDFKFSAAVWALKVGPLGLSDAWENGVATKEYLQDVGKDATDGLSKEEIKGLMWLTLRAEAWRWRVHAYYP
jgi:hypothetical protein